MANVNADKLELMAMGLSDANHHVRRAYKSGGAQAVANNDTLTMVFADLIGTPWVPHSAVFGVYANGAGGSGSVGARAITMTPAVLTSWDESTGTLVVTNTSGGTITNPFCEVLFFAGGSTPA